MCSAASSPCPADGARARRSERRRQVYLQVLTWSFTLFNSARAFAYLPNIWSIHAMADSSQHSLATWLVLLGANFTMALWLWEQNGQQMNKAIVINISNALMCLLTAVSIGWYRF